MTNVQLYTAIGIPIVINTLVLGFFWMHMNVRFDAVNQRIDDGNRQVNQRFDDMRDMWRTELRRVEEVLDARLNHLEDKP